MYHVYILELKDGTLYTGQTNNLERRLGEHRSGRGSKYVRSRRPFNLAYTETYQTRSEAMRREYQIKQYSRRMKMELIDVNG